MEARSPNRFDIGKTLERVQGPMRLGLEQYRSRARTAASLNPSLGPVRAPDAAVLRERRIVPLNEFSGSGEPHSIVAPEPPPQSITVPAAIPPMPADDLNAAPTAGNPFGDDSAVGPAPKSQPKAAQSKTPPAKAATPKSPPAKLPIPPAPSQRRRLQKVPTTTRRIRSSRTASQGRHSRLPIKPNTHANFRRFTTTRGSSQTAMNRPALRRSILVLFTGDPRAFGRL